MREFNSSFMIGAATAAHQVEGNNVNSDTWIMENIPESTFKEKSLDAADHYNRYKEDIQYLIDVGCNTYRFSIEWARIEPEKDRFDKNEIEHYKQVLEFCHQNKITPIVTLHHFTSPKWLIAEGGWESEKTIEYFGRYSKTIASELGNLTPYICTINEANMGKQITKIMKTMSNSFGNDSKNNDENPGVQVGLNINMKEKMMKYYQALGEAFEISPSDVQPFLGPKTENGELIIMKCHEIARKVIKEISPNTQVGITLSIYDHQALPGGEEFVKSEQQDDFLNYLPYLQEDDFLGVQNYSRKIHGPNGVVKQNETTRLTKMGYEYYPEALGNVLRFVSEHWDKPIIVTENGVSTDNDEERVEFIRRALTGVHQCISEGIPVIGYTHWSLLDNFEWQLGYDQKFGLIAVDRSTQRRYPKDSLSFLGKVKTDGFY
jgi:beta-glucosidase